MKRLFATTLGLIAGVLLASAQTGQQPGRGAFGFYSDYTFDLLPLTNSLAADTTNFPALTLDLRRYGEVGFYSLFKGAGLGTQPVNYRFRTSPDATNWVSNPSMVWTVSQNSTNQAGQATNWNIGTWGFIQFYAIENGSTTNAMTNHQVFMVTKPMRYGFK